MKKIIALMLVICICFSMVGCSAITTAHAATTEEVVEEEEKGLDDILTEVAAGLLASWLASEFEEYVNQLQDAEAEQTEQTSTTHIPDEDVVPLTK